MYQHIHVLLQVTVALRMVDVCLNPRIMLHLTVQMKLGAGVRLNTRRAVRTGSDHLQSAVSVHLYKQGAALCWKWESPTHGILQVAYVTSVG
jgi:hypothetical protein